MGRAWVGGLVLAAVAVAVWVERAPGDGGASVDDTDEPTVPSGRLEAGPAARSHAGSAPSSADRVADGEHRSHADHQAARSRSLEVVAICEDAQPLAGVTVVAIPRDGGAEVVALTDAAGRAALQIPWAGAGRVAIRRGGGEFAMQPFPAAGASAGRSPELGTSSTPASPISLFVSRRQALALNVTRAGAPFLPPSFAVTVGTIPFLVQSTYPDSARIIGSFPAPPDPTPLSLTFAADGFPTLTVAVPVDPTRTPVDVHLDLEPAGPSLTVEVRAPQDLIGPLILSRWDEAKGAWAFARFLSVVGCENGLGRVVVEGLAAGRYQVLEGLAATTSEPVTLARGGAPAVVRFAFPNAGTVRGRVVVPRSIEAGSCRVGLWDGTRAEGPPRVTCGVSGPDFAFSIQVPGDRPVTLRALHAVGDAYGACGTVTVTEPQDGVELRVEEAAAVATMELVAPEGDSAPRSRTVYVTLWDAAARRVAWSDHASVDGERIRIGGYVPGTYDVVVDDFLHAPLVLEHLPLGAGTTDLGRRTLTYGATIRLRTIAPDGVPVPRWLLAIAERLDDPRVGTWARNSVGDRIRGVVPGRYRVSFSSPAETLPPATGVEQTVVVVEGQDAEATIDFHGPEVAPPK